MFYKFGQIARVHIPTATRNQDARFDFSHPTSLTLAHANEMINKHPDR
ncbi:hypothetical protein [Parafrankia elaeagni]|nr:hypothetical protein [Parafrankia elaeagni]